MFGVSIDLPKLLHETFHVLNLLACPCDGEMLFALLRARGEGQIVTVPRWLFALTPRVLSDTRRRDSNPGCSEHRLRAWSPLSSHAVEVVCGEKCVPAVPASVQGWLQGSQELIHASSCSHTSSHALTSGSLHAENRITSCMISLTAKTDPAKLLLVCRAEGWSE